MRTVLPILNSPESGFSSPITIRKIVVFPAPLGPMIPTMPLRSEANVLLLDEPTNDIDVNTLRALEEAIENFAGCAVIISHDRWFLDRVCTHILAFEDDSQVYYFEGGYSDYEENKKKRLGDITPHRVRYKSLVKN